eukprot:14550985-Alexandrium_andersonii.AAC.1
MAAAMGSCSQRPSAIMETDSPEVLKRSIEYVITVSTGVPRATHAGSTRFHLAWSSRSASVTRSSATRCPEEATVVFRGTMVHHGGALGASVKKQRWIPTWRQ